MSVLPQSFFARDALTVAKELIGCVLVREHNGVREAAIITETEAYVGPHDLACHAARGRTPRTEVMFGPPGNWYVYFVYGMHWMLNVVTNEDGYPAAVLIRGVTGTNGPGRVARRFRIDKTLYGLPAARSAGLWVEEPAAPVDASHILTTPRIGVDYAGAWADEPLRFVLASEELKRRIRPIRT
jgi:DNA-3-methyladenine glycosylase